MSDQPTSDSDGGAEAEQEPVAAPAQAPQGDGDAEAAAAPESSTKEATEQAEGAGDAGTQVQEPASDAPARGWAARWGLSLGRGTRSLTERFEAVAKSAADVALTTAAGEQLAAAEREPTRPLGVIAGALAEHLGAAMQRQSSSTDDAGWLADAELWALVQELQAAASGRSKSAPRPRAVERSEGASRD